MKDSNFLRENNARHFWHPMTHPLDSLENAPKIMTHGEGVHVVDIDGHKAIDAVGGLWNVNLGYSCEPVKQAITEQLNGLPYFSTFRGVSNDKVIELSYELAEFFKPDGLSKAFFTSGGSDSIEVSLKLARQYHRVRGEATRTKFISLRHSYHGVHYGGASISGAQRFRSSYEPGLAGCFHIPTPYTYRNQFNEADPARLAELCANALDAEITHQGANTVAAFIMEPVLGAGGVIPPHEAFMPMVREICDRHGVLLIADEVITAFGRTGHETGSRHWGVKPDLMATAKAITNGYFPFGAAMISEKVVEVIQSDESPTANMAQGYTYSGHPVGAAAALAALGEIKKQRIWENAAVRGDELFAGLNALAEKYDVIGDVRGGEGLMCAMEIVEDRASKKPAAGDVLNALYEGTYEDGVLIRISGNNVILSPPLVLTKEHVDKIISALTTGFSRL